MAYEGIAPLPPVLRDASDRRLRALERVWTDRRRYLERTSSVSPLLEHLHREWAIETGLIERVYQHDRGVTQTLIEHGIDASLLVHAGQPADQANRAVAMMLDHKAVVDGLFAFVKNEDALSHHYIRALHQQLVAHQETTRARDSQGRWLDVPLLRGQYKEQPNNVERPDGSLHDYCPPHRTQEEMQQLLDWNVEYTNAGVASEVLAAWLHHRFTQIHPFMDGNGRVARTLASIVFLRAGGVPLVVRESDAANYYGLLRQADEGDLEPLVRFFAARQAELLMHLVDLDPPVDERATVDDIVLAVLSELDGDRPPDPPFADAIRVAEGLRDGVSSKLKEHAALISTRLRQVDSRWRAGVSSNRMDPNLRALVTMVLGDMNESTKADWNALSDLHALTIRTENEIQIGLAVYARHARFRGIVSAVGLVVERDATGDVVSVEALQSAGVFSITYADDASEVAGRFARWLSEVVRHGVARWGELAKLSMPDGHPPTG